MRLRLDSRTYRAVYDGDKRWVLVETSLKLIGVAYTARGAKIMVEEARRETQSRVRRGRK